MGWCRGSRRSGAGIGPTPPLRDPAPAPARLDGPPRGQAEPGLPRGTGGARRRGRGRARPGPARGAAGPQRQASGRELGLRAGDRGRGRGAPPASSRAAFSSPSVPRLRSCRRRIRPRGPPPRPPRPAPSHRAYCHLPRSSPVTHPIPSPPPLLSRAQDPGVPQRPDPDSGRFLLLLPHGPLAALGTPLSHLVLLLHLGPPSNPRSSLQHPQAAPTWRHPLSQPLESHTHLSCSPTPGEDSPISTDLSLQNPPVPWGPPQCSRSLSQALPSAPLTLPRPPSQPSQSVQRWQRGRDPGLRTRQVHLEPHLCSF